MHVLIFGDGRSANVTSFLDGLQSNGANVALASFDGDSVDHLLRAPRHIGALRYPAAALQARRLVSSERPDVVIGYFASGYGTLARMSGHHPLVQIIAGSDVLAMDGRRVAGSITKRNLRGSELVVAWSPELSRVAEAWGVDTSNILVESRGVDVDEFQPPNHRPPATRLITTRALHPIYRHAITLEAISRLEHPVHLTMVGDGPDRSSLEHLARARRVSSSVTFTGRVRPPALAEHLRTSSIYVSTCMTDGVSASLLEAMACGLLPVVVDNEANRSWVTHGTNGLLTDGSIESLTGAIGLALDDRRLRERAAIRNREIVVKRADRSVNMRLITDRVRDLTVERV